MDILESVSFLFIFLQCCNLSQNYVDRSNWTIKPSRLLEIYSVVVFLLSLAMLLYELFGDNDLINKSSDNDVAQTVNSIQLFGIRVAHIVSIFESFTRRNEQNTFVRQVREIDRIFECALNVQIDNSLLRRQFLHRGAIMVSFSVCCQIIILFSQILGGNHYFLLNWVLYLLPFIVCGLRYLQIFGVILTVRHRVETLVTILNALDLLHNKAKPPTDSQLVKTIATVHLIGQPVPIFEAPDYKNRRYDLENSDMKRLLVVRDLYNRLWELTGIINNSFGVSMLVNVGNDFICITSNCYWIFLKFEGYGGTFEDLLRIISSVVWFVPHVINVLVLALICERTVERTKAIALGLHRIETNIWNDNQNTVIEQFSLQLLHQKFSFSAAGFFDVNCTLLYTIAGATTTYLIILIQFHMSEQKPNTI